MVIGYNRVLSSRGPAHQGDPFHTRFQEFTMFRPTSLSLLMAVCSFTTVFADKNASIETKLGTIGSPVVQESFDSTLAKAMIPVKGQWKILDGTLVAKELAADKHAAVLNYQKKNRNSVVRFSFKLDGNTNGFNFSLNHAGGHLFRVVVAPTKISLNLDKDKKDPDSKALVMATAKGTFERGKWYTLQVEMAGKQVVAQTDNGLTVEATHDKLDTEKPNYRFVMRGESLALDDLRIWELN